MLGGPSWFESEKSPRSSELIGGARRHLRAVLRRVGFDRAKDRKLMRRRAQREERPGRPAVVRALGDDEAECTRLSTDRTDQRPFVLCRTRAAVCPRAMSSR